jgi:hypothetical protein
MRMQFHFVDSGAHRGTTAMATASGGLDGEARAGRPMQASSTVNRKARNSVCIMMRKDGMGVIVLTG